MYMLTLMNLLLYGRGGSFKEICVRIIAVWCVVLFCVDVGVLRGKESFSLPTYH